MAEEPLDQSQQQPAQQAAEQPAAQPVLDSTALDTQSTVAAELASLPPTERLFAILSGLGFYKLTKQRQKQLRYSLIGSTAAFALFLIVFGSWIIMTSRDEKQTIFQTPPPSRTYEPKKLEHKVKLQKQQRSSSRPSMLPRIISMKISNLSLPDIKMDPKLIHTSFQPKFKAVSGKGLGAGLGTGYGEAGFGAGVSSVNFFGIQARGDKIAVCVDVSVSMVEEQVGGVAGFMRVKQRVEEVIDALSEAGMFNVIVFADAAQTFEKQLVVASNENKKRAKTFIRPYNTEGNYGLTTGNVQGSSRGLPAGGGTTRLDLALTASYEMGADTILVISDGLPKVRKVFSAEQAQAQALSQAQWAQANAAQIAAYNAAAAAAAAGPTITERVWVPPTPPQPAVPPRPPSKQPPKEGQPIDRGDPGRPAQPGKPGYWQDITHRPGGGGGGPPRPAPPPPPDPGWWTLTDFVMHLDMLTEALYVPKGRKPPIIHCIGYQIDQEGHEFLNNLSEHYHGKYRRVQKLR